MVREARRKAQIRVKCEGISLITLPASYWDASKNKFVDGEGTATRKGKDIVITEITIDNPLAQGDPLTYLELTGSATAGKQVGYGVALKSGILYFGAKSGVPGNPLKISEIQLDEDE